MGQEAGPHQAPRRVEYSSSGWILSELSQIEAAVLNLSKFVKSNEDALLLHPEDIKKAGESFL